MTVSADEFLRRFLVHVLPKGSSASGTSDSSPTVDESHRCCVAVSCSGPLRRHSSLLGVVSLDAYSARSPCSSSNGCHQLLLTPMVPPLPSLVSKPTDLT